MLTTHRNWLKRLYRWVASSAMGPVERQRKRRRGFRPCLEMLETRLAPANLTPLQVATAYGVNLINFGTASNSIPGNGAGQTIAIIDPGDDADLVNTGPGNFNS